MPSVGNRRRLYTARAVHVRRRHQVLSTPDRLLSPFISHSLTVGVPWRNFLNGVWDKVPDRSVFILGDTLIFLKHSVAQAERNLYAKNQLDLCSRFDTIPHS